jgi:phosphoribosylanthranilate isomerase
MKVDFMGFIFYEKSPRYALNNLALKEIAELPHRKKVGVFVNEGVKGILEITSEAQLDFIQLHGDEDTSYISLLKSHLSSEIKIIKVLRIRADIENLQFTINNSNSADYYLFDTDSAVFGGTGKTFDWQTLNNLEIPKPYFLSGGISPENVQNLSLLKQQPFALDINSKFENSPGDKNVEMIREFKKHLNQMEQNENFPPQKKYIL